MKKSLSFKLVIDSFSVLFILSCFLSFPSEAAYIPVYSTTDNGGISWTGNTLGLNKTTNLNEPGIAGSIGAFTTIDPKLQVGSFPLGTTLEWKLNSSSAILDLPPDSTVLHAELVWSGSYGFDPEIIVDILNTPITFTTPDLTAHSIDPNPATAQSRIDVSNSGFYVRSADVTALVTNGGTYTVGGVPGTVIASENVSNCAGWTLQVAYRNPNSLTCNLSLFVACEKAGDPPLLVSGFHAPDVGPVISSLYVSVLGAHSQLSKNHLLVGAALPLTYPSNRVSGTNNPPSNIFASQINTLLPLTTAISSGKLIPSGSSVLDTRGTFGTLNSLASGISIFGARQGYDITSVDLTSQISNAQEQLYIQATTDSDNYTITALGMSLEICSPIIKAQKNITPTGPISLNDKLQYTINLTNVGFDATALVFKEILPEGLTFVPSSFTVNGNLVKPDPDLAKGTSIGDLAAGANTVITFEVQVASVKSLLDHINPSIIEYNFLPEGQALLSLVSQTNQVFLKAEGMPTPAALDVNYIITANTSLNSSLLGKDSESFLRIINKSAPSESGASLWMQPDGTFYYTPPTGYSGTDSFSYMFQDSNDQQSNDAKVTITILPLALGDSGEVAFNTTLNQTVSVLSNDVGIGLSISDFKATSAQKGSVEMKSDGTYSYTPPLNYSGIDTFDYTVTDKIGNSATAQVTITVLEAATNDLGITPANTPLKGRTGLSNKIASGFTLVSYTPDTNAGGKVEMSLEDGSYVYVPSENFSGIDTFTYTERDMDKNLSISTVKITTTPLAANTTVSTMVNTPLRGESVLSTSKGLTLSVLSYDVESINGGQVMMNSLTGEYVYTPPLNFKGTDGFTYTIRDGVGNTSAATMTIIITPNTQGDFAMTVVNTILVGPSVLSKDSDRILQIVNFDNLSVNEAIVSMNTDGTYSYIPPVNFLGVDSFNYVVMDSAGNQSLPIPQIIGVIPLAINYMATTPQDTPLKGAIMINNNPGSSFIVVGYSSSFLQGGSLLLNNDGTYVYTPSLGFTGADSFNYVVQDANGNQFTGMITIFVTPAGTQNSFKGILQAFSLFNKTIYKLKMTWPDNSEAMFYHFYLDGLLIGSVPASQRIFTICVSSIEAAERVQMTSVDKNNVESARVTIDIIN